MLGHTANAKKSSKFEDADSRMSRPRAVSELPQRPSQRLKPPPPPAAGAEATGGTPRRALGVRCAAPRSPLHEKKPAGPGAGPRVAELEAKLEKAHGQLMGMRDQLAAAEKARKDARAALVEAKKRLGAKKRDDAASSAPPVEHGDDKVPAPTDDGAEGANGEKGYMSSPVTDAFEAVVPSESRNNNDGPVVKEGNKTSDEEEARSNAVADGDDGKKGSPEVELLRAKLMAKDMEVYELRARLMVIDTEVDDLKRKVMSKGTELEEMKAKLMLNDELVDKLTANLMVKDAEIAALEADNADLTKVAEEAAEAVKAASARARETEHALRESAAREARLAERLRASEHAREALEAEAQRSRVQSEQWRKAAEEAAAVLGGGVDRVAGARNTDKRRYGSASAGACESEGTTAKEGDEDGTSGKRKAGGAMRALSDLWKKKAQK
ncbi:hypothetical protein SEVIR_3G184500v4 [Setaria viridis]|uniref:Uncharacterized protein n=1 Tax=Setaria viridis TaxID=4556 RepID=A0A4U6VAL2_SETVI|nr:interactor of constitutive active ROPs 1-like [Setaria viridis]TKW26371.1 hypothetical protein SEVIR_3G184500v2 [Setaria viridis]